MQHINETCITKKFKIVKAKSQDFKSIIQKLYFTLTKINTNFEKFTTSYLNSIVEIDLNFITNYLIKNQIRKDIIEVFKIVKNTFKQVNIINKSDYMIIDYVYKTIKYIWDYTLSGIQYENVEWREEILEVNIEFTKLFEDNNIYTEEEKDINVFQVIKGMIKFENFRYDWYMTMSQIINDIKTFKIQKEIIMEICIYILDINKISVYLGNIILHEIQKIYKFHTSYERMATINNENIINRTIVECDTEAIIMNDLIYLVRSLMKKSCKTEIILIESKSDNQVTIIKYEEKENCINVKQENMNQMITEGEIYQILAIVANYMNLTNVINDVICYFKRYGYKNMEEGYNIRKDLLKIYDINLEKYENIKANKLIYCYMLLLNEQVVNDSKHIACPENIVVRNKLELNLHKKKYLYVNKGFLFAPMILKTLIDNKLFVIKFKKNKYYKIRTLLNSVKNMPFKEIEQLILQLSKMYKIIGEPLDLIKKQILIDRNLKNKATCIWHEDTEYEICVIKNKIDDNTNITLEVITNALIQFNYENFKFLCIILYGYYTSNNNICSCNYPNILAIKSFALKNTYTYCMECFRRNEGIPIDEAVMTLDVYMINIIVTVEAEKGCKDIWTDLVR